MPRTFSLARLLLVITAFCILCGVAVNVLENPFIAFIFVPTAFATLVLAGFSRHRALLIFNALVGATFGFALHPAFERLVDPGPRTWESPDLSLISPALGALLFGGIFLLAEKLDSRTRTNNRAITP
jgi:hypothetical protein